ncbi:Hypothetical protein R9X50_00433300 [Acrodontium crateriforme]|uniref:Uncharacterized protein n=1 Tax=Acrodontium crateriforme TaxID=150365 RepID=A0AAQ3MAV0_9PEZI|nr:Hypothetical protein R9X50_00433300 [Acrodontium crateriforme]
MPRKAPIPTVEKDVPVTKTYDADPLWRNKPLTPSAVLVQDVRLEQWRETREPLLEIAERSATAIVPDSAAITPSVGYMRAADASSNPIEKQTFTGLEDEYGWIRHLRLQQYQQSAFDSDESAKCRWIHCSSKFPEYLNGFLWALSNDLTTISDSMRILDHVVQRQTRFSKHGKYFAPFCQTLQPPSSHGSDESIYPMLISVPFLDWTVLGPTPPLRFQVDRREGFQSSRSSSHLMRSVLQYFYRLEDTLDREKSQVFAKHKPWSSNRELDLKVRQWYGHYPSALNVDELWILAVDAQHIVTFSSNQTWKSRSPPLQLTSRISDLSFRGIRNTFYTSDRTSEYTAMTHVVASLSGAVGMMHRNFWPDLVLCLTDRYAGHLSQLQYRLHRAPSTKLVLDLIACQEELNIVIQITQQQLDVIGILQSAVKAVSGDDDTVDIPSPVSTSRRPVSAGYDEYMAYSSLRRGNAAERSRATYRQLSASTLTDPVAQLLDNLQRELADLQDLRDNTDRLVTRTIQLVNIRLEDHGKAILVFTVVTIVFLPLNFVSSFFGMNFSDIRNMQATQGLFWTVALCLTVGVVAASVFLAFSGGDIVEKVLLWRDARKAKALSLRTLQQQTIGRGEVGDGGFQVFGVSRGDGYT